MTSPVQQVAIHGTNINTWILALIALVNTVLGGGVLTWWIKSRGGWKKDELDADEKLRSEMWRDIAALKESKENQSQRLTVAETRIAEQTSEIGQLRFIVALVNSELERVSPGNAIAKQVRIIMEDLQSKALNKPNPSDIGEMAAMMARMCIVKGPNE